MNRGARALCTLAAALIAAGSFSHDADARRRGNAQPRPAERSEARSGSVHREVTRTGPGGETRTRQRDTTWTRGGGQATRDTTWTGSNGRTATRHDEVQRTENGRTSHSIHTGPNGRTATRDASVVRDPEAGTRTKDVTWTRPDGSTTTRTTTLSRTPSGAGTPSAEAPAAE